MYSNSLDDDDEPLYTAGHHNMYFMLAEGHEYIIGHNGEVILKGSSRSIEHLRWKGHTESTAKVSCHDTYLNNLLFRDCLSLTTIQVSSVFTQLSKQMM